MYRDARKEYAIENSRAIAGRRITRRRLSYALLVLYFNTRILFIRRSEDSMELNRYDYPFDTNYFKTSPVSSRCVGHGIAVCWESSVYAYRSSRAQIILHILSNTGSHLPPTAEVSDVICATARIAQFR